MYQHPSDWHNNTGVIRGREARLGRRAGHGHHPDARERAMRLMDQRGVSAADGLGGGNRATEIDVLDVGRLLLNYVLSDPYVGVALV